jgi:quinol monooxygenase YgiN
MYARVTFSKASPDQTDQALKIVRESIVPVARQQKGFKGYLLLTDQATGKSINITLWETGADRNTSDQSSEYYREAIGRLAAFFTAPPVVENYDVSIYE